MLRPRNKPIAASLGVAEPQCNLWKLVGGRVTGHAVSRTIGALVEWRCPRARDDKRCQVGGASWLSLSSIRWALCGLKHIQVGGVPASSGVVAHSIEHTVLKAAVAPRLLGKR
jgi:hypothetical protein